MIPLTPAAIYTAVRDFLIVAAISFLVYRIYTDGKNAVTAAQMKELQAQIAAQAKITSQWHTESTDANTQLAASLGRINAAPVVVHDWVQQPAGCPAPVLPAAASAPSGIATLGRGTEPVSGATPGDAGMRDAAVAAFKRQWEGQIATWRSEHAQWPQP